MAHPWRAALPGCAEDTALIYTHGRHPADDEGNEMGKFLGTTIALECNGHGMVGRLVKVEYTQAGDKVKLSAVSGRTLGRMQGTTEITQEAFDARPSDTCDKAGQAIWALAQVGYTPMALDVEHRG